MANWNIIIKGIHPLQERQRNGEIEFEQMRDSIVKILRSKLKRYLTNEDSWSGQELALILDELADVESADHYDQVKAYLYGWCDANGVWIDPIE